MSSSINECPICHKEVERDSLFCRHCGKPIPREPADARALLDRTATFCTDLAGAMDAVEEFVRRWPESPEARDVRLASECMRLMLGEAEIVAGTFALERRYVDISSLLTQCAEGLPSRLANGLITSARIRDEPRRAQIMKLLRFMQDQAAAALQPLYDAAAKESLSLLVNGKPRALTMGVSFQDAMRDADVYAGALDAGDLERARKGFTYLKELNSKQSSFRYLLGEALRRQNKPVQALQEVLYGWSLAPRDEDLAGSLILLLCGLSLYPTAVEALRHYAAIGKDLQALRPAGLVILAKSVSAACCLAQARCSAADLSPQAPDLIEHFDIASRAWLNTPEAPWKDEFGKARVFISYRWRGGIDFATKLERALKVDYPSMHVFRDETWIVPGGDIVDELRHEIDTTDIFLALIDRDWARRLHNPGDVVKRELGRAIDRGRKVIPVLLEDAEMPRANELPDGLKDFSKLLALRITEHSFSEDLPRLQAAMTNAFSASEIQRKKVFEELDRVAELKKHDPEAAARIIARWSEALPQYVSAVSTHGEGVPNENMELAGQWECSATILEATLHIRFLAESAEGTDRQSFSGEFWSSPKGLLSFLKLKRTKIEGSWAPVRDVDKDLVLGINLDGLQNGASIFKLTIPIHRRVGNKFVGTDANGVTYVSTNTRPQRHSL